MSETPPEPEAYDEYDPTGLDLASQIARQTARTAPLLPEPKTAPKVHRRRSRNFDEQRSGARPDDRDPQQLGRLIDQVGQRRGWKKQINLTTVLRNWAALVGADNAEHSTPIQFADGILTIQCDSTAWATGLRYSASKLVAKLNAELGQETVKRIEIRGPNAPSWKKGPRSVRDGRGPRDTYG